MFKAKVCYVVWLVDYILQFLCWILGTGLAAFLRLVPPTQWETVKRTFLGGFLYF